MDAVLNWLWQGGVVAVALRLMLFPLERASANVRYVGVLGRRAVRDRLARTAITPIDAGVTRSISRNRRAMRLSRCPTRGGRRRS